MTQVFSMVTRSFKNKLEVKKQESGIQVLLKTARLAGDLALRRANQQRKHTTPLRPSHTALFPHIDFEGVRITTLAERVGISKQAVSQLIGDLEQRGTVELNADPSDGRAKLVRYTKRGQRELLEGLQLLREIELEIEQTIGDKKLRLFRKTLAELLDYFEKESA